MADFGDDAGNEIQHWLQRLFEESIRRAGYRRYSGTKSEGAHTEETSKASRWQSMWEKAQAWYERQFRSDSTVEDPQSQALAVSRRPSLGISMPSSEIANQFAAYARDNGIWAYAFEGPNGEPMLGCYQEDTQKLTQLAEEWARQNPAPGQEWTEHAKEQVVRQEDAEKAAEQDRALPPAERSYMKDIREIVESARHGAVSEADFIERCEAQGLTVSRATDGELLFTHENGWFDVRGDTLGPAYTRDSFERGVGEKSEPDLTQHSVEEQGRYIQSHDGGDIDARTQVVEHTINTDPVQESKKRDAKTKGYDLDSEARDMRDASKALDSNRGPKEIGPLER